MFDVSRPDDDTQPAGASASTAGASAAEQAFDDLAARMAQPDFDIGSGAYDAWKNIGEKWLNTLPEWLRDIFQQCNQSLAMRRLYQGPQMSGAMKFWGLVLKECGDYFNGNHHGGLYQEGVNHHMLIEHDGKIGKITKNAKDLQGRNIGFYSLFPMISGDDPHAESRWPRLVLTSHHARSGGPKDVTAITHGIEAMMRQCFPKQEGRKHPPLYDFNTKSFFDQLKEAQQHTHEHHRKQHLVMGYACDVEANPFLNAAALLRRIGVLSSSKSDANYDETSQSAYRLAKTILQCLVTEPERIDPDFKGWIKDQKNFGSEPLKLRPDAERVAQHIALIGYSKGGNVVSDAMRLLVDELGKKRSDGRSLFYMVDKLRYESISPQDAHYVPVSAETAKQTNRNIASIVKNIPLLSLAALEVPMAQRYKDAGVHRLSINNENDLISGHTSLMDSAAQDEVLWVKGTRDLLGHEPKHALGTKEEPGYILKNPQARRRVEEVFSALYGAAAIGALSFKYDAAHMQKNRLVIEPAAGTPDALIIDHCKAIKAALEKHRFTDVVVPVENNLHEIQIHTHEPLFLTKQHPNQQEIDEILANLDRLKAAMDDLRDHEPKLVVNMGISDDIARHRETIKKSTWAGREDAVKDVDLGARMAGLFGG